MTFSLKHIILNEAGKRVRHFTKGFLKNQKYSDEVPWVLREDSKKCNLGLCHAVLILSYLEYVTQPKRPQTWKSIREQIY